MTRHRDYPVRLTVAFPAVAGYVTVAATVSDAFTIVRVQDQIR